MGARPQPLTAALAQMNPVVGDIAGNVRRIAELTAAARDQGAALVVFPELALTGYPPEDLLLKTHFLDATGVALGELAASTHGIVALVGFPERADDVYNSAARAGRRRGGGHLPQDAPAQLRRLRRAALLPGRHPPGERRPQRRDRRDHHLRGHLGAGPAGHR